MSPERNTVMIKYSFVCDCKTHVDVYLDQWTSPPDGVKCKACGHVAWIDDEQGSSEGASTPQSGDVVWYMADVEVRKSVASEDSDEDMAMAEEPLEIWSLDDHAAGAPPKK